MPQKLSFIGIIAGIFSIYAYLNLVYINPYNNVTIAGPLPYPFFLLFLPACLAIFSSLMYKQKFMLIAFIWSLPMTLFLGAMPDLSNGYCIISILYFISFLLIRFNRIRY